MIHADFLFIRGNRNITCFKDPNDTWMPALFLEKGLWRLFDLNALNETSLWHLLFDALHKSLDRSAEPWILSKLSEGVCLSAGTYDNLLMLTLESILNQSIHLSFAWRQSCSFMSYIKGAKLSPWCTAELYLLSLSSIWHNSGLLSIVTLKCVIYNYNLKLSKCSKCCLSSSDFRFSQITLWSDSDCDCHWLIS